MEARLNCQAAGSGRAMMRLKSADPPWYTIDTPVCCSGVEAHLRRTAAQAMPKAGQSMASTRERKSARWESDFWTKSMTNPSRESS